MINKLDVLLRHDYVRIIPVKASLSVAMILSAFIAGIAGAQQDSPPTLQPSIASLQQPTPPTTPTSLSTLSATQVNEARDNALATMGLLRPLAASQREALQRSPGNSIERKLIAERLGSLYARMLAQDITPDERKSLERHASDLLSLVPDAATPALRLELLTAQYRPVEEIVERRELLLGEKAEEFEAERVLRDVVPKFINIANELTSIERAVFEKRQRGSESDADIEKTDTLLRSTRELRATARFRAGWACYYLAVITKDKSFAAEAMQQFGAVLNAAPGRPATVDRLPTELLENDAIAKATLGCALASSLLDNSTEPARWIRELENAENLAPSVRAQLLRRAVTIYAAGDSWSSLDLMINRYRTPDPGKPARILEVADARALAVASLSALRRGHLTQALAERAQSAARTAMSDLIARGEVSHVVAMVKVFGTAIISEEGFISNYVRGLCAFDDARAAHKLTSPQTPEGTTTDSTSLTLYRQASQLTAAAMASTDSAQFPHQQLGAMMCQGLALLYSGSHIAAADIFERAFTLPANTSQLQTQANELQSTSTPTKRDALRLAVVSLSRHIDEAVKANPAAKVSSDISARREQLVTLYIQTYPNTRDANLMLYSRYKSGKALTREDIDALLAVSRDDPVYEAARGIASDALYKLYRQSAGQRGSDALAMRFADVAEELLRIEFSKLTSPTPDQLSGQPLLDASTVAINRGRRVVEALLTNSMPDVARAEAVLHLIDSITVYNNISTAGFSDELTLRRYQIAHIRRDFTAADRELAKLRGGDGPYAAIAERYSYQRALDIRRSRPDDQEAANNLIVTGSRLLAQKGLSQSAQSSVRDAIAAAASMLYQNTRIESHRDLALRMDEQLAQDGVVTQQSLRRIALLRESKQEWQKSADAWLAILASQGEGTQLWYEARYESLRLIAKFDSSQASTIFTQFRSLHPRLGGPPWDEKFALIAAELNITTIQNNSNRSDK